MDMHTLLYVKWITKVLLLAQGPLLNVMWQPDGRAVWGECVHMYVWLVPSLFI